MSEKEKRNKEAMSNLLSGLTSFGTGDSETQADRDNTATTGKQVTKGKRGRPPRSEKYKPVSLVVNDEHYEKMRVIADRTGSSIKEVYEKADGAFIEKYEKKFGIIKIHRKQNLDTMFED